MKIKISKTCSILCRIWIVLLDDLKNILKKLKWYKNKLNLKKLQLQSKLVQKAVQRNDQPSYIIWHNISFFYTKISYREPMKHI